VDVYNDLLNRTDEIVPRISQYHINPKKYDLTTLATIQSYLHELKKRGVYGIGRAEVKL